MTTPSFPKADINVDKVILYKSQPARIKQTRGSGPIHPAIPPPSIRSDKRLTVLPAPSIEIGDFVVVTSGIQRIEGKLMSEGPRSVTLLQEDCVVEICNPDTKCIKATDVSYLSWLQIDPETPISFVLPIQWNAESELNLLDSVLKTTIFYQSEVNLSLFTKELIISTAFSHKEVNETCLPSFSGVGVRGEHSDSGSREIQDVSVWKFTDQFIASRSFESIPLETRKVSWKNHFSASAGLKTVTYGYRVRNPDKDLLRIPAGTISVYSGDDLLVRKGTNEENLIDDSWLDISCGVTSKLDCISKVKVEPDVIDRNSVQFQEPLTRSSSYVGDVSKPVSKTGKIHITGEVIDHERASDDTSPLKQVYLRYEYPGDLTTTSDVDFKKKGSSLIIVVSGAFDITFEYSGSTPLAK